MGRGGWDFPAVECASTPPHPINAGVSVTLEAEGSGVDHLGTR